METRAALAARGMPCTIADLAVSAVVPTPIRVARRLLWSMEQAGRHPGRGMALARSVHASSVGSARDAVAGTVQWLAVQRAADRARRRHGVHLLEEGPVQTVWTLGLRAGRDVASGRLPALAAHTRTDLVVVVEAPVALAAERLRERSSIHSRTQRLVELERQAELERGHELLRALLGVMGGPQLLVVNDGSVTPRDLARGVAEWVLRTA